MKQKSSIKPYQYLFKLLKDTFYYLKIKSDFDNKTPGA